MMRQLLVICAATVCGCTIFSDPDQVVGADSGTAADATDDGPDQSTDAAQDASPPVTDTAPDTDDASGDMMPRDVAPDMAPVCESPLVIASPSPLWSTSNTIRWEWSWVRDDVALESLEIVMGRTEDDVLNRRNVLVFTKAEMAELGIVAGPDRQTEGSTWGLEPATNYYAQFGAVDVDGCRSRLPIVSASTEPALGNDYVIFSEEAIDGYSDPGEFTYSNRNPGSGLFHYEWLADCGGDTDCFVNLQWLGLDDVVTIASEDFDSAIVEFMALNEGTVYGRFWQVRMAIGPSNDRQLWKVEQVPNLGPTQVWRTHQIPLSRFEYDGRRMTAADISGRQIWEWSLGAQFEDGTYGNVDEVRIRW